MKRLPALSKLPRSALGQLAMPDGGIDKFEAAQRQLDCAIRLWVADEDSLGIHTLAYAACCLLRDLLGTRKQKSFASLRDHRGSGRFRTL